MARAASAPQVLVKALMPSGVRFGDGDVAWKWCRCQYTLSISFHFVALVL